MFASPLFVCLLALLIGLALFSASAPPAYAYASAQYSDGNYPARYYRCR